MVVTVKRRDMGGSHWRRGDSLVKWTREMIALWETLVRCVCTERLVLQQEPHEQGGAPRARRDKTPRPSLPSRASIYRAADVCCRCCSEQKGIIKKKRHWVAVQLELDKWAEKSRTHTGRFGRILFSLFCANWMWLTPDELPKEHLWAIPSKKVLQPFSTILQVEIHVLFINFF